MTPRLYARKEAPTPRTAVILSRLWVLRQQEERARMLLHGKPQTGDPYEQARREAQLLTRQATDGEIKAAIRKVERSFGRSYAQIRQAKKLPVDTGEEIFDLLKGLRVTAAELAAWADTVRRTPFPLGTGHPLLPLPALPEANAIITRVLADLKPSKAQASLFLAVKVAPLTRDEILEAIALDFWDEMPVSGKMEAWRMIPEAEQKAIRLRIGADAPREIKWAAVRDYHLEIIRRKAAEAATKKAAS